MPSVDYANTFVDSTNIFVNYVDKSANYAHTFYDSTNKSIDSANAPNTLTSYFCILDSFFLQLSLNDWFVI
jgi:hypothetical protein